MAAGQAGGGSGSSFAHLHVHTEYSMLDGAARLNELFAECERAGMTAVAITDHGNLYGAYDFWTKAQAAGAQIAFNTGGGLAALVMGQLLESRLRNAWRMARLAWDALGR